MLPTRWHRLAALAVGVTLAHLWLIGEILPDRLGEGAVETRPRRIEVAFVRELQPVAPPPVVAPPPRPRPRAVSPAPPPEPAASAATAPEIGTADGATAATAEDAAETVAQPVTDTPAETVTEVVEAAVEPAVAASAAAFEWPPSTRLSYRLTGHYRGPVEGQAQVEWLRAGARYQVFMDLSIGPAFAPLMRRRAASEGEITPEGLHPRRYDEETRIVLRDPRRLVIVMDEDRVHLPGGSVLPRPPGLQDSASQFVQLTWLFTTQPALLQQGVAIDLPLALPRRVQTWTYDVLEEQILYTPAGAVPAWHVKPRREPGVGGDLTAEVWVAPSLQYLPVRMLIRQDAENHLDLQLERLPLQAERGR